MFQSKTRAVIVPQSEHLKLVGELSFLWGNQHFDLPPLPRLSFVEGVATHDRGYGYLDTLSVGNADEEDWLKIVQKGFYMPASDPIADIVARLHILRLVSGQDTPARSQFAEEMRTVINKQITESGVPDAIFQRADRITKFCDRISFDFCFEEPAEGEISIFPKNSSDEQVIVKYEVDGEDIRISPWPLSVEEVSGYLVGYQSEGYRERLVPVLRQYHIQRGH